MTISGVPQSPNYGVSRWGTETLVWSNGHYGYPDFNAANVGGDFQVAYKRNENGFVDTGGIGGGGPYKNWQYSGQLGTDTNFNLTTMAFADPSTWGAELWSKMKPDRPNMQLLNALYELKDLPGMLRQRFELNGLHTIGSYYLALKFGWQPLLQDILSFVQTQMNAQKRLEQLLRDEGKPVRRKLHLSNSSSMTAEGSGPGNLGPSFVSYFYWRQGVYKNTIQVTDKVWGSARFRYWLPPGPRDINWTTNMKAKIFGLNPTPRVIYNAIPWSWLIDWYAHLGYLLDNLQTSLVDRLAADYFYVMRQREQVATNQVTSYCLRGPAEEKVTLTACGSNISGNKVRMQGDPFGWATHSNSLSGVQLSILGALGLSRLR